MGGFGKNVGAVLLTGAIVSVSAGCANISSQKVDPKDFRLRAAEGMVYHLPLRAMRFDVTVAASSRTKEAMDAVDAHKVAIKSKTDEVGHSAKDAVTAVAKAQDAAVAVSRVRGPSEDLKAKARQAQKDAEQALEAQKVAENGLKAAREKLDRLQAELATAKDIRAVTVSVVDNAAVETVADMRSSYLLRYNRNLVADNNVAVAVNSYGLLSISHAQSVNRINEIAANAAASAIALSMGAGPGAGGTPAAPSPTKFVDPFAWSGKSAGPAYVAPMPSTATVSVPEDKAGECREGDKFSVVIDPQSLPNGPSGKYWTRRLCGVEIIVVRDFMPEPDAAVDTRKSDSMASWKAVWGINLYGRAMRNVVYYKQNMTYTVGVCRAMSTTGTPIIASTPSANQQVYEFDASVWNPCVRESHVDGGAAGMDFAHTTSTLKATSPNESPVYHAGISRTVFADSTSDISLNNGVISAVENSGSSELLGAVRVPTSILNAGTSAVSGVFSSLQGISKAQNNYIFSQTAEKLGESGAAASLMGCNAAIAKMQGAVSDGDKAAALAAVKTACPLSEAK